MFILEKVDFVILWVDGSDENWLREKMKYDSSITDPASGAARYRDWDNLQYWFRGVEKFAPWVNKVFFITWGHLPKWLNPDHPKLRIVKHEEFIPEKYLPTFNSNTIELNIHRITDLAEHIIVFNDDMFVLKGTNISDFFQNGKPVDQFILNTITPSPNMPIIPHTIINNVRIINKYFHKNEVYKENLERIFNLKYGAQLVRTIALSMWKEFTGFTNPHLPQAHLKSTFDLLWEKEYKVLDETCMNKFRKYNDVNHWLMRYWNLCSGNFVPRGSDFGKYFNIPENEKEALNYIKKQKGKTICINDTTQQFDFTQAVADFKSAFDLVFPEKSDFEL